MDEKFKTAYAELAKKDRQALAELIVEYVDPKHVTTDIVGMFLNTRNLMPGDALVKKVRRGVEIRQLVPGQTTLASQINIKDNVNYNLDQAYAEVSHNEWEVESGEIGTVDSIRAEMTAKLSDFYVAKVMTALYTLAAINDSRNFYVNASGITRSTLEDAIDFVADEAGSIRTVVGRRTALAPITKFAGYRIGSASTEGSTTTMVPNPETLSRIQNTGWFGMYYGASFLALEQVYDNPYDRNALIQDDLIAVIGENCGEFITYGDVREDQWTDMSTAPPTWHIRIYQQFGMMFDNLNNIVLIKTTS